ncbi:hypothetical protein Cgig2_031356 [Carnegiea gigantea]|uniref:Uncharacterized protein n=1 Tax=Carnegiea gigantea TaxID=171969 RepID=A0A9Q1JQC0_9CARY|nr:hypothetical protein Cgig2_031356 [Carnegiea gigantea]
MGTVSYFGRLLLSVIISHSRVGANSICTDLEVKFGVVEFIWIEDLQSGVRATDISVDPEVKFGVVEFIPGCGGMCGIEINPNYIKHAIIDETPSSHFRHSFYRFWLKFDLQELCNVGSFPNMASCKIFWGTGVLQIRGAVFDRWLVAGNRGVRIFVFGQFHL